MNVYTQIAERMKAERAEAANKSRQQIITPGQQIITPQTTNPAAEDKKGYVYVPALGLYVSEDKYLHGYRWDQAQQLLHKEGRRMPTIPEFIEFLKYLRSNDGRLIVRPAQRILDEIYKVTGNRRSEWLDAKFEEKSDGMYVFYYVFEDNGRIVQKQEKLEDYLTDDKTPGIDLDFWLASHTKQGLPRVNCPKGKLHYWSPKNGHIAGFVSNPIKAYLSCIGDTDDPSVNLGVRYVEPRKDNTKEIETDEQTEINLEDGSLFQ